MNGDDLLTPEEALRAADILSSAAAGLLEDAATAAAQNPGLGGYDALAKTITDRCDDAQAIARVLAILARYTKGTTTQISA